MNIALRPSGGRGEYELAGTQGELHPSDVFGLPIFIEILPTVAVNAYSKCLLKDGNGDFLPFAVSQPRHFAKMLKKPTIRAVCFPA
jgi:hypothetical protein